MSKQSKEPPQKLVDIITINYSVVTEGGSQAIVTVIYTPNGKFLASECTVLLEEGQEAPSQEGYL